MGGVVSFAHWGVPIFAPAVYEAGVGEANGVPAGEEPKPFVATHVALPEEVRAIYMTSWVAGTRSRRAELVRLIDETELNAIVIDIKDYSGRISFEVTDPLLVRFGAAEKRIQDIREFIADLHRRNVYVIGRITVFQDPYLSKVKPEWAVKKESATSTVWTDYKGLSFIDPGAKEAWDYTTALSRESYEIGFDELNFDYIRFPSDGNMRDIYYSYSNARIAADPALGKAKIMRDFFKHLHTTLKNPSFYESNTIAKRSIVPVLSADLFGMTMTNKDDLNIGQILEYVEPYFDYIAPMVYPSHYPKGFIGLASPAANPYEVVHYSMNRGVQRMLTASSTSEKLRPWLQDFNLGATYDAAMVRKQIQATYDVGLDSWMMWDAANTYTRDALLPAPVNASN
ncbi:MAG: hypothetical protein HY457_01685 [Parcubacteria group bacterium]|nr:hypothetical protein [Parcubacteria group bacterium]